MEFYEKNEKIRKLLKSHIEEIIGSIPDKLDITMINVEYTATDGKSGSQIARDLASPRRPILLYGTRDKDRIIDGDFQSAISRHGVSYWNYTDGINVLGNFIAYHYAIKIPTDPLSIRSAEHQAWIKQMTEAFHTNGSA